MLTDNEIRSWQVRIRIIQLVALGLISGAAVFAAMIGVIANWDAVDHQIKMMSSMAAATGFLMFGLALVAPRMFMRSPSSRREDPASEVERNSAIDQILSSLSTETVLRFALLEAGVFLNVVVFLLEPKWIGVGIAGMGLVLMLICFPRRSWLVSKLDERLSDWDRSYAG